MIKKILFITLSNIGDVILTLPSLDYLIASFPKAKITVMVSGRAKEIFENNPLIAEVIVYHKQLRLRDKINLFQRLRKEKFDLVVDLRNTLLGIMLPVKYKTSPFLYIPRKIKHMRDRHLYKVTRYTLHVTRGVSLDRKCGLYLAAEDEKYAQQILERNGIKTDEKIIIIAAGARSDVKRWPKENFADLISTVIKELGAKIILAGDQNDARINKYIKENLPYPVLDLSGQTNLRQLACLLKRSSLLVANDSAIGHLAGYLDTPVAAIFGPTSEEKYGPWTGKSVVIKKEISCRPCEKAQCRFGTLACLRLIKTEDVFKAIKYMLFTESRPAYCGAGSPSPAPRYRRILVSRIDRLGDVVLSMPVIRALRDVYPNAYIAMMLSPYAKEVAEGNPYLDEVIIYDKDKTHRSWFQTIKFALGLKRNKFDLALILHPANRAHIIAFLSGARKRVGYNRNFSFLLTDRLGHNKQLGEKHESEYALDLARYLGIEPKEKKLFMPLNPESERWVVELLKKEGWEKEKLLIIHPGASCLSKFWPQERFAEAADRLKEKYGFKVFLVGGEKDRETAKRVKENMRSPVLDLTGQTSISQLASLIKRCALFISNDSGPAHIAAALERPVISIFGRNQKGLSPKRWRPLGEKSAVLHKEIGCIKCLAHNCAKDFACLKAITVDDVAAAAESLLI